MSDSPKPSKINKNSNYKGELVPPNKLRFKALNQCVLRLSVAVRASITPRSSSLDFSSRTPNNEEEEPELLRNRSLDTHPRGHTIPRSSPGWERHTVIFIIRPSVFSSQLFDRRLCVGQSDTNKIVSRLFSSWLLRQLRQIGRQSQDKWQTNVYTCCLPQPYKLRTFVTIVCFKASNSV